MRFFDLAENLRFADDERIEAGSDAEQVTGRIEIDQVVHVRDDLAALHAVKLTDERLQIRPRDPHVVAGGVQFRAVAGGEDDGLVGRSASGQRFECGLEASLEVDALAQVHWRGPMTEADEQEVHYLEP